MTAEERGEAGGTELALAAEFVVAARDAAFGIPEFKRGLTGASTLADEIIANGPLAIAATKRVLIESGEWPADEVWHVQADIIDIIDPVFVSNDAEEGALAFAEKRSARRMNP
ncbi:hypothetical protein HZU40_03255 [Mycolicibacterium fluoranthenivorans]|uniref:Enoyl-CoA hydratase/isomerase family protein n=1 Tax=Mycolicibacterium fluoranthenivorans TaxID=258505 RepID=A0A7G8PGC2_9MYCO|nr:hypothetical protein HZU40_03255 [Mycolicibacterium fluoranthenivorans]